MRAVVYERYGGPDGLRVASVAIPTPAADEIRVRVSACAVNLSDWEYLVGSPFYTRMIDGLLRPRTQILGSDIVGVIDELGSEVSGFSVGQRVMGDFVMTRRGFAEFACVPARDAVIVPADLTDEIAACLPQAGGIAVSGSAGVEKGTRLLINGAGGGSGTMALQLAKAAGAHVTAVDNSTKIEWLRSLGADEVLDYREVDFAESGKRWDMILDMVATRGPRRIAKALADGGSYKAVGGGVPVLLALVFGGRQWSRNRSIGMLFVPSGQALTERVARMAIEGSIRPHIDSVLPLAKVADAIARTGRGEVRGKVVIRPGL